MAKYLTNKQLLVEIEKSKERLREIQRGDTPTPDEINQAVTPELVRQLILLVERIASKSSWSGYSWLDLMISESIAQVIEVSLKFDVEKVREKNPNATPNPFSYYTKVIENTMRSVWRREMNQQMIRDEIIEQNSLATPGEEAKVSYRRRIQNLEYDTSGYKLDGTVGNPNVVLKPRIGRPRRAKKPTMTKQQERRELERLVKEYYASRGKEEGKDV
ncbi:MAG: hypothetical protein D6698_11425 [Gammaproteobacteria bacterium]|nr:MAG: hypothetical protein D6698_11425 [Gammaproteobacteria bacterium]